MRRLLVLACLVVAAARPTDHGRAADDAATTLGRSAPPGREVVKTFRGRGDGVLVGGRTLEDEARRYWTTTAD